MGYYCFLLWFGDAFNFVLTCVVYCVYERANWMSLFGGGCAMYTNRFMSQPALTVSGLDYGLLRSNSPRRTSSSFSLATILIVTAYEHELLLRSQRTVVIVIPFL